ncbi:hypothetical protein BTI_4338 [Burkholderia thailandensis MSMB121]|uniref:hypothetical protein n=1 Tax=Burkholderia humptydooensis TaxID=430531 RepID=UPI000327F8EF|nr:hypothetical protein [Burkholderia humptydooensis]AGK50160.1 hypothetical protein BTI_4338 [Burkholderia thailandensis MSMB121]
MANAREYQRVPQRSRISQILAQLAALTDFMHGDGCEAFAALSDGTQRELQCLFVTLGAELQAEVLE